MDPGRAELLAIIATVAQDLPRSVVDDFCDALETMPDDASTGQRSALPGIVGSPTARARVTGLIETWSSAPDVGPASLAWALRAASEADERRRHEQTAELVWSGPAPGGTVLRRTDQVLLDLIRTARHTLYVVTFAAYRVPVLNEAMLAAARRGVDIFLIFESPEAGKITFAATEAVGEELGTLSHVYAWPLDRRPKDAAGRHGSLHAKCAVSDEHSVLISSANLTEYALALNMELGLLVRGGDLPGQVVGHLRRLIEKDILARQ